MNVATQAKASAAAATAPTHVGQLHGRRLVLARTIWLLTAAIVVGLFLASLPPAYQLYQTPCTDPACAEQNVRLTPQGFAALQLHGISPGFFAAWNVGLDTIFFRWLPLPRPP